MVEQQLGASEEHRRRLGHHFGASVESSKNPRRVQCGSKTVLMMALWWPKTKGGSEALGTQSLGMVEAAGIEFSAPVRVSSTFAV